MRIQAFPLIVILVLLWVTSLCIIVADADAMGATKHADFVMVNNLTQKKYSLFSVVLSVISIIDLTLGLSQLQDITMLSAIS